VSGHTPWYVLKAKRWLRQHGYVILTAEESARMRESYELWREGTPRKIEGRGIVSLADEEIEWGLARLAPVKS